MDWDRQLLVDFNAGKTVLFGQSNNTDAIEVKMDGSIVEEKSSCKMLGLSFSSKLDVAFTLSPLLKLQRKLEPWFVLWSFFLLRLLFVSVNLPYRLAWNIVMSGLLLLVSTWRRYVTFKNGYVRLPVLHLLPLEPLGHRRNVATLQPPFL